MPQYVQGPTTLPQSTNRRMCHDGTYVTGSNCSLAPDGTYTAGTPRITPNGSYVGSAGRIIMCPDGSYVAGAQCKLAPNGMWYGVTP